MGLQLRLHELFAQDETNTGWTEWGSDDMYLGGVALELRGPDKKPTVHKMPFFKIGTFDDNDRETFDPPRTFDNYGFGPNVFPKDVAVTFILAEKDEGNTMNKVLDELHERIEDEAAQIKADQADDGKGEGEGGNGGIPWGAVVAAVTKAIDAVYDKWKGDEVFEPQQLEFSMESEDHRWNGNPTSPVETIDFRGHGGHYTLKYDLNMNFTASGT